MQDLKLLKYFFRHCAEAWVDLREWLITTVSINTFKSSIINFVRPRKSSLFAVHGINSEKLLSHLRLDFSHINEHKFGHNFSVVINALCSCGKEPEATPQWYLCFKRILKKCFGKKSFESFTLWSRRLNLPDKFWNFKVHNKFN